MVDEPTVEDYLAEMRGEEPAEAEEREAAATSTDSEDEATEDSEDTPEETEGEEAEEEQEASSGGEDTPEDSPKPKRRRRGRPDPEKRIKQLVAERNIEREERLKMAARLEVLERNAQQPPQDAAKPQEPRPPRQEDFTDYAEYLDARSAYAAEQAVKMAWDQAQQNAAETQKAAAAEKRQGELSAKAKALFAKGSEEYEDFEEVAADQTLPVTETMTMAMLESDIGHQVQYHLGSNPDEAQRISQLTPVQQVREMALLEATLKAPKQKARKKTTRAPEPIKPVGGKSGTKPQEGDDEMPIEQYMDNYFEQFQPRR